MNVIQTAADGAPTLELFSDARGFFMENSNEKTFDPLVGCEDDVLVQDHHSRVTGGVLRGFTMPGRRTLGAS